MGRSKWLPSLGRSAGARLATTRPGRQGEAQAGEGGPHALTRLAHRLVGQADDDEGRGTPPTTCTSTSTRRASMPFERQRRDARRHRSPRLIPIRPHTVHGAWAVARTKVELKGKS